MSLDEHTTALLKRKLALLKSKLGRDVPRKYKPIIFNVDENPPFARIGSAYSSALKRSLFLEEVVEGDRSLAEIFQNNAALSPFGLELYRFIQGAVFIDLGCGGENARYALDLAGQCQASRYIGVDNNSRNLDFEDYPRDSYIEGNILVGTSDEVDTFFVLEDMLRFVSGIQPLGKVVFYLSGMQIRNALPFGELPASFLDNPGNKPYLEYFSAVQEEILRVCDFESGILLGPTTTRYGHFDPNNSKGSFRVRSSSSENLSNSDHLLLVRN